MGGILPLVLMEGDQDKVNAMGNTMVRMPYIEFAIPGIPSALDVMDKRCPPRIMKTHLRCEFFQRQVEEHKLKVILVLRNPKDTLVSYYHMYCSQEEVFGKFDRSFHDFFELVKIKRLQYGDIFDWYTSWWGMKDMPNVMVVKYEDMSKDCAEVVRKVAKFCDKDLDNDTAEKIVDLCTIDKMRNEMKRAVEQEKTSFDAHKFFRKGIVGDWKNYFTDEESGYIDQLCKEHLDPLGLTFEYE